MNYPQTSMEHWISMSAVVCFRWLALFLSLKASYRLHQLRSWGEPEGENQEKYLRNKDFLLGVNFPLSFPNLSSCPLLKVSNYFSISYLCSTPFPFLSINKSNKVKDDLRKPKSSQRSESSVLLQLITYNLIDILCMCTVYVYLYFNIYFIHNPTEKYTYFQCSALYTCVCICVTTT